MLCHKTPEGVRFERQNWKEWFSFLVSYELRNQLKFPLPIGYYCTKIDYMRGVTVYWVWFIFPFIKIGQGISFLWWGLARFFLYRHLLHLPTDRGLKLSWFWPRYFWK